MAIAGYKLQRTYLQRKKVQTRLLILRIIGPGPEFESAILLIERKVLDVDEAGALVDGQWLPLHRSCVRD